MPLGVAIPVFVVCLAATLVAAAAFAHRLDLVAEHYGLPEGVVGLLTAAGADAPELSSAVVALAGGSSAAGLGVIAGSNVFNLAAMLGLSALVAGRVRVPVRAALLEGGAATGVAAAVALFAFGLVPAWALALLTLAVVAPYVAALSRSPRCERVPAGPGEIRRAVGEIVVLLAVIVGGSVGMVDGALDVAHRIGVSDVLVGALLLAVLTSLPNALTGLRLGRRGRAEALLAETMNSNTINLAGGVALPALAGAFAASFSGIARTDVIWLLAASAGAALLLLPKGGLGRAGGVLLVGSWLGFALVQGFFG